MNLSEVRMNLYRVEVSEISTMDAFGVHIGHNKPEVDENIPPQIIKLLHVASDNMKGAIDFLYSIGVEPIRIEKVDVLLNT